MLIGDLQHHAGELIGMSHLTSTTEGQWGEWT
jgi:hypothetical protein